MHTSDLVAQLTGIAIATIGMIIAWIISRHRTPAPPAVPRAPAADAERPVNG